MAQTDVKSQLALVKVPFCIIWDVVRGVPPALVPIPEVCGVSTLEADLGVLLSSAVAVLVDEDVKPLDRGCLFRVLARAAAIRAGKRTAPTGPRESSGRFGPGSNMRHGSEGRNPERVPLTRRTGSVVRTRR